MWFLVYLLGQFSVNRGRTEEAYASCFLVNKEEYRTKSHYFSVVQGMFITDSLSSRVKSLTVSHGSTRPENRPNSTLRLKSSSQLILTQHLIQLTQNHLIRNLIPRWVQFWLIKEVYTISPQHAEASLECWMLCKFACSHNRDRQDRQFQSSELTQQS